MSAIRDAWIDRARDVRIETVLAQRGITLKGRNGKLAGPCPVCGGTDRFAVNLNKGNSGVFFCRQCIGKGGDAISLVEFLDQCDFLRAVETLAGPPPDDDGKKETAEEREQRERDQRERIEHERIEREAREAAEVRATLRYCARLWGETVPLPPEAVAYFAKRKIDIADVPDQGGLRWHRAFPLWIDGPTRPSIVARLTDPLTGAPGGIWHRPLTGEKPKALGPMKDHVIRLWPDDAITNGLVIGEGVETVIAAATRIVHRGTLLRPAWACVCRTNIRDFPILPDIDALTICADNDACGHGQDDARECAKRWANAGREAEVLIPNESGADFNDIAVST